MDITYNVECQRCEGIVCQSCGDKIRYEPTNVGLTDTKMTVSELEAHLNYTFTVETHSGVSVFVTLANKPLPAISLTTSMLYTGACS